MRDYLLIGLFTFFLTFSIGFAQQDEDVRISGNYYQMPFDDFAKVFYASTGVQIFYKKAWTDSLMIDFGGNNILFSTLFNNFFDTSQFTFVRYKKSIIILKSKEATGPLRFKIQDYRHEREELEQDNALESRYRSRFLKQDVDSVIVGVKRPGGNNKKVYVSGKISDSENNEPIIGASLYIEELGIGFVSNLEGFINMHIQPGVYNGVIRYLNKKDKKLHLTINSDGIFAVELKKKVVSIKELTVIRDKNNSLENMSLGNDHVETEMLKKLPVLMGEQDLLKAIQMLPGVISGGEGTSGFYVRGSNADQNLVLLNDIPIYNTNHLFGFFGAFNSNAISDVALYKSNIPAEYGGRLSSLVDVKAKSGSTNRFNVRGGISPVTANLLVDGPLKQKKGAFLLGLRSSYSDYLLSKLEAPSFKNSSAYFGDLTFNTVYNFSPGNSIAWSSYVSKDGFSLSGTNDYDYIIAGNSLSYRFQLNPYLNADAVLIDSRYHYENSDRLSASRAYQRSFSLVHDELKLRFNYYKLDQHLLRFGGDMVLYNLDRGTIKPLQDELSLLDESVLGKERAAEMAVYIQDQYKVNEWLSISAGLRYNVYTYLGPGDMNLYVEDKPRTELYIQEVKSYGDFEGSHFYSNPDLRVGINAALTDQSALKFGFNQMSQYLFMVSNTNAITPSDQWKLSDFNLKPQRSMLASLGYYHSFHSPALSTSIEIYGKKMKNIVDYIDGADLVFSKNIEMELLQGKQDAYGVELSVQKMKGRWTGWLSYAYSRSIMTIDGTHPWERVNGGLAYASNYDKPHSLSVTSNYNVSRRLSLSSNLIYSTGRPITYPREVFYLEGVKVINYSARNAHRIPDYFRLDAALNIEGNLKQKKAFHSWWSVGVYNLTGRKNAYSVFFKQKDNMLRSYKLSIIGVPVFTVSYNFKLGNYASN